LLAVVEVDATVMEAPPRVVPEVAGTEDSIVQEEITAAEEPIRAVVEEADVMPYQLLQQPQAALEELELDMLYKNAKF
jgi:hypothetical protein